jgi:hypothetical protein
MRVNAAKYHRKPVRGQSGNYVFETDKPGSTMRVYVFDE